MKMRILYGTGVCFSLIIAAIIYFQIGKPQLTYAAVTGDYRTVASGNWNTLSVWETFTGAAWIPALTAPSGSSNDIEIRSSHTVTVNTAISANQVIIDNGGILTIASNTLTISNGTGVDLINNGTMNVSGTVAFTSSSTHSIAGTTIVNSTGILTFGTSHITTISGRFIHKGGTVPTTASFWAITATGVYQHDFNGGSLPLFTWTAGSTCDITGTTTTLPGNVSQTFSNVIWNCPNQSTVGNHASSFKNINGNFTISSTGSSYIYFDKQGNNLIMNIGGNFNVTGGTTYICENGSSTTNIGGNMNVTGGIFNVNKSGAAGYGNTSAFINIIGNLNVTGGIFDMSQSSANNIGIGMGEVNLNGNLTVLSPGIITETQSSKGIINFSGTTIQTYNCENQIANTIDFVIKSGAIVRCSGKILTSGGDFTLMASGHLMIDSPNGITNTTLTGNIQVTGIRSYSNAADYTYEGSAYQVTGDGLPSQVRNLTLNNSNHCALTTSCSASGTLTFTSGNWIAANDTLTLGISSTTLGTLSRTSGYVVGYFARWFDLTKPTNVLFPIGTMTNYNGANFSFTTAPTTAGRIVSIFIPTNPGTIGLPQTDGSDYCTTMGYAYWQFGATNSFAGGTYNVNVYANGFPEIYDYTALHIVRRNNAASPWAFNGAHASGTGSNIAPIANRTGMNILGQYAITSSGLNPLPVQLVSFTGVLTNGNVNLAWRTNAEVNNDYFRVERSADGKKFTEIKRVPGSGTTSTPHEYAAIDANPLSGISYYRLTQVDYDGKWESSNLVKIKYNTAVSELKILSVVPNPFSDLAEISYEYYGTEKLTLTILNSQGITIFSTSLNYDSGKNVYNYVQGSDLKPGSYILQLKSNSEIKTARILKI